MSEQGDGGFQEFVANVRNVAEAAAPEVIGAGVGAVAGLALSECAARLDALMNPQIIQALQEHLNWWQIFSTKHAISALVLNQNPYLIVTILALGALTGAGAVGKIRNS